MPSPIKEYRCKAHGPFESRAKNPRCPSGCSGAAVYWSPRTAPGIRTNQVMKGMDALQTQLAGQFGLGDMRVQHEGESVMGNRKPHERPQPAMSAQEYMMMAAQQRAPMLQSGKVAGNGGPVLGMWGNPAGLPGVPVTPPDKHGEPTPLAGPKFGSEMPAPAPVQYLKHKDSSKDGEMLQAFSSRTSEL